jgi:RNA polymerase sigma-70 factor (ECF subfamily)
VRDSGDKSESDLLRLISSGNEDAFRTIYNQHQGPVYRFALHMSGSPTIAEDVTQEVFMALIEKRSRFDASRGTLRSYLLGVARNLLSRRFERDQRFVAFPEPSPSDESSRQNSDNRVIPSAPPLDPVRNDNIERVRRAVLSLPADYRETVVLCELQEFSYEEAAGILGCPVGTVRSRLHRARTILAEKLGELRQTQHRPSFSRIEICPEDAL